MRCILMLTVPEGSVSQVLQLPLGVLRITQLQIN
jgi:hypothetical protein